jgi:hypothetical protein
MLWMIPITQRELSVAKDLGSERLSEHLAAEGFGHIHRDRRETL